jgi:ABC-2 type transport system permease protein
MRKIALIAGREVMAAITSRGFVVGLILAPTMMVIMAVAMPWLMTAPGPLIVGEVGVVDPTGRVLAELGRSIAPEAIAARRERTRAEAVAIATNGAVAAGPPPLNITGEPPRLTLVDQTGSGVDAGRRWLMQPSAEVRRLALVVTHASAVMPAGTPPAFGTYDLYVAPNLDDRIETEVRRAVREALVTARAGARNVNRDELDSLTQVSPPRSMTVLASGDRTTERGFNRLMPFVLAGLLVFGVMIGGQTLLTATVEEKSSRVIEVLLSAVSPFELMAGKILGQMAVGLMVMALYLGLGVLMLTSFAMLGLVNPWLVACLLCFFVINYFLFASLFCAIGAAVNEMREAQALMMPVMLLLMGPWLVAPAIAREPNAVFSVVLSFIPPANLFAMLVRMASSSPPPAWQVGVTMAIGVAAAVATTWCAAKVFRVGLLMHGKPPNFATLVRWARN